MTNQEKLLQLDALITALVDEVTKEVNWEFACDRGLQSMINDAGDSKSAKKNLIEYIINTSW